jgi:two-component system, sensor histidine kinase and response regulator
MGGASTVDTGRLVARPMRPVGVAARVSAALPTGGTLPDDVWRVRHQGIVTVLWLHVPLLFVFALIRGNSWPHGLLEAGAVAISAAAAQWSRERRRESTIFAAVGLMTASAVLVHLSGGMIEAHFHFFVMVGVIVLYQDWRPFLVAIAFVVLHHGVIGVLSPEDVYNHRGAWEHPWTWAAIHGLFILAMSVAGIANWKLNERSQSQLSRLAAIVESSDDAVYGWTLDGTITSWNEGAARLFGYTHNEVVGRPISLLVPPERAEEAAGQVECLRSGHRVDPFESEARRGDGGVVEVSVTNFAVRTPAGEVVGGATIARDITERRRAERDLQNTLSLLGATLESTADGILVVDPDGRITSFNTRFAEMWRLPASILASGDDRAAISFVLDQLQDPDAFVAKVQSLYHQPEAESHDTLHFKDGREFERSSKPQRVAGAVVGRVWSFHDVTDRKRLEAELAGARDKALDASRLKSEFLATMSHEIRTPMNGVIGLTSLLLDTPLTEPQRQFAHGIHTSGEALLKIINDILDFSKIEAGKLELEMMDFDLGEAIEEVAALAAEPARARGLELVTYASPAIPGVRGDVGRLRQVLLNLVSNAVKFTSDGEVVIRASVGPSFDRGEVMVRLEVTDTGIGIAPEATENLFEPFSQADASTTRRYGGTGLGLAICRRLTEAMGGTIGVQSELGHGSTFWLDLPLVPATQPARPSDAPEHSLSGLRVLIVDDNQTSRQVLASQLLAWNIAADVAPDADAALQHLRGAVAGSHPYDVALVDMAMPGMDGLELGRAICADPELSSLRLLLLSSVAVDPQDAAGAGYRVRLTKPARLSQLRLALAPSGGFAGEEGPATAAAPVPTAGPRGRLLIVEDNAINQAVARGLAANLGYSCDVAGNGIEALAALERRSYDAVLMDCQMPEMDGFQATAEIRRREGGAPPVPIIAMTAGALVEDRERCLAAGMDDYLPKPVKRAELTRVLDRWLCADTGTPVR